MPNDFWDRTPHHTNLVETAHAGTNRSTQINLRPLEVIQWARTLDASVAASIAAAKQTCIFCNPHNGQIDRMTRSLTHQTKMLVDVQPTKILMTILKMFKNVSRMPPRLKRICEKN
ncbi:hypothetical protein L208DRAFT_1475796 [Tricholoma matsutake]|nr:hypothetical protein L208DRAFT_1475796 [Tricholoma matsutake 945]